MSGFHITSMVLTPHHAATVPWGGGGGGVQSFCALDLPLHSTGHVLLQAHART
jgi:hypothetical protein